MTKTKPCTIGPKHKWDWKQNLTVYTGNLRTTRISLKGLYRCACGERKFGEPNHNATQDAGR